MPDEDFNVQRARDLETVYKAGKMPEAMKADYEKVRSHLQERLQDEDRTFLGAVGEGISSIPESGVNFVKDVAQPFLHPIATAEALANLGEGVAEKVGRALGISSGGQYEQSADAVWDMLKERYGGWKEIKRTLAKDPVGFLADASLLAGGGALALRGAGAAGKVAKGLETVSRATDPVTLGAKALKPVGHVAAEIIGGPVTNVGGEAIKRAATSGYEGGTKGADFRANLRGQTSTKDVVDKARHATSNISAMQKFEYARDIKRLNRSPVILSWNDVDTALADIEDISTYSGRSGMGPTQVISAETEAVRDEINDIVDHWKKLQSSQFHTVEGFDILKKKIGEINVTPGTAAEKVKTMAYDAVRNTIIKQDPEYARIMRSYEEAAGLLDEMRRTMSMGKNATTDTAMRKLLSALRNNVNTNFGRRAELTEHLTRAGAPNLMEELAGLSMSGMMPHGLARLFMTGEAGGLLLFNHPYLIPLIAAHSPRITGEALHGAGRVVGAMKPLRADLPLAFQAGRQKEEQEKRIPHITVHPLPPDQRIPSGAEMLDNPSGIDLDQAGP